MCVSAAPQEREDRVGAVAASGMELAHRDPDRALDSAGQRDMLCIGVVLITVSIANQSHSTYLLTFLWFWG